MYQSDDRDLHEPFYRLILLIVNQCNEDDTITKNRVHLRTNRKNTIYDMVCVCATYIKKNEFSLSGNSSST